MELWLSAPCAHNKVTWKGNSYSRMELWLSAPCAHSVASFSCGNHTVHLLVLSARPLEEEFQEHVRGDSLERVDFMARQRKAGGGA
jgi:hypothetical protein